ncbi:MULTISPECIES: DUF748 domain-containing protein [unclassified Herbaspirillum]|uniref:DUF748 domain-containing protein n=1 Tax=unclassified Herbaspirillum TaxID=2624150 RepID=UPI00114EA54C|nr:MULTISPECIES: DUF748 domain-containing protein [unclassified Herbaspirillum]MBB5391245.1 outer membrane protein OmpA-like peptidoglycan-associated protein [Herbaspirillum sp. SJZ102]TQK13067.1 uncharacterized protein involved in outer membrane biogenesis [Herbaspirillum sp. SJZ130]TQK15071.1 uncharacterized protein involved in outer membrane biogenesis [Herbaspirillum sp. SJZ106]TWC67416.1 uncharacterized protein involved in outer membrane biogenesis [Herbaspirillum sp. SJZ099]
MANPGIAATLNNWKSQQRLRRPLKWLAWILVVLLALAAASWLALPSFIKKIAIEQTQEKIGRKLDIGKIDFNPFRLALTVSDVTLYEPDQKTPFFAARSLLVNASSASLFRLAPVLDEIKLTAPDVHVVRLDAEGIGHYNFSDILERIDAMPKSDSKSQFSLANVQLQDGKIRFEDKVTGKDINVQALQIGLPFISNLPGSIDSSVQPQLSADINGTPFHLQGRSKPFASTQESTFAIDIDQLDVVSYLPFVPVALPVKLQSAKLTTKLDLGFVRTDGKPKVALSGDLALEDISVQDKSQAQLFKAKKLAANIKQFDVLNASGEIAQISLEAPQVWAAMNARGDINWVRALASGQTAKPAKPAQASDAPAAQTPAPSAAEKKDAAILVQQLSVRDGEINWRDEANAAPAQNVQLSQFSVDASQLSTDADAKPAALKISLVENGRGKLAFDGDIAPLKPQLNGKLTLDGIDIAGYQNYLNRSLAANVSGALSGASTIQFQDKQLKLSDTSLDLANLKLAPKVKNANAITVKSIALQQASLDLAAHLAQADAIRISGLSGDIRREGDGSFNLQRLQAAAPAPAAAERAPEPSGNKAPAKGTPPSPWVARLNTFSLADSSLNFEDAAAGAKSRLKIHGINLQVQNLSSKLDRDTKLSLQAQFDKSGKLDINGQAAPQLKDINLNLDAKSLPIAPFQGYFANALNVTLTSGLLSAKGKLAVTPPLEQRKFALSYNGSAAVNNLRMQDKITSTDFLRWRALDLSGIRAKLGGRTQISLDKIALTNFYARTILSEKGRLNLQDILVSDAQSQGSITNADKQDNKEPKDTASAPKTVTSAAPVTAAADPNAPIVRIGQVVLAAGNINYTDNFVKPNYTANMTDLAGTIGEISSEKPQPAPVNISGKIDNDAPLQISGSLNPLFKPMFLDIKASANGVQLPRLTPYSAKYAGYPITKGKLSMDVQYKIENDKLVAENDVRIEQLTFGERVDSPDATKLPVMLAVSLLKDRNGNINLNLPISGSLSDPQFSVGGIILRVFVNLIVKAVTSPFALIGSMFNGSDDIGELRYIEFAPGSAEITPEIRKKLDALGYVLNERPGIKLDITGRVDPKIDDQGLRQEALNRQMRTLKRKDLMDKEGQPAGAVQISDAERPKYLERVYKDAKFKKPRNMIGLAKSLPPEEMQKLITDNTEVTQDDLRNLAQRRADQVRNYLQEQSVIPAERIFLIAPKLSADGIPDKEATTRVDLGIQ